MRSIKEIILLKKNIKNKYGMSRKLQIREVTDLKNKFINSARQDQETYFYFYKYYAAMYAVLMRPFSKGVNNIREKAVYCKNGEAPLNARIVSKNRYNIKRNWILNEQKEQLKMKFCEIHIFPKKNNYFCYLYNVTNIFFFKKHLHTLDLMTNSGLKNFIQAKKRTSLPALERGVSYLISKMISLYSNFYKTKKLFLIVRTINIANMNTIQFIKNIFVKYNINIHFFFVSYKKPYGYFRARK